MRERRRTSRVRSQSTLWIILSFIYKIIARYAIYLSILWHIEKVKRMNMNKTFFLNSKQN